MLSSEGSAPEAKSLLDTLNEDFLLKQLCYLQMNRMDQTRVRVCRKIKEELRSRFGLRDRASSDLAVRMEQSLHRAYFLQLATYRQAVVWLVRELQVASPHQSNSVEASQLAAFSSRCAAVFTRARV